MLVVSEQYERAPLHYAVFDGPHRDVVKLLLDRGATVDAKDNVCVYTSDL